MDMKHAEGNISCNAAQKSCVMEWSICCWNVMRRADDSRTYAQWLREGWDRRPGFLQKRGMLVVESGYVISTGNGCYLN